jgi:hypothetical protein
MNTRMTVAITMLFMVGHPASAAKLVTCDEFRSRLPLAESTLKMPVPKISFVDEGTVANYHDYTLADLQNFSADLRCRRDGRFGNFQIQQLDRDDYSGKRFVALATAAIWAYTGWPVVKIRAILSDLAREAGQGLEATKIRGDKFKDGRADRELGNGVQLQVSGGEFGLWMMIDASVAEDK